MRFLLKAKVPNAAGNDAARNGVLGKIISEILQEQKPEAVYFTAEDGMRTAYVFLNMDDASEIPKIAEPWFLALDAEVELLPVMTPEDLEKAGPHIENAVNKFASS